MSLYCMIVDFITITNIMPKKKQTVPNIISFILNSFLELNFIFVILFSFLQYFIKLSKYCSISSIVGFSRDNTLLIKLNNTSRFTTKFLEVRSVIFLWLRLLNNKNLILPKYMHFQFS